MSHKMLTGLPARVLAEFAPRFFDAKVCTRWLLDIYYPDGPRCPDCNARITSPVTVQRFIQLQRFTCPDCNSRPPRHQRHPARFQQPRAP